MLVHQRVTTISFWHPRRWLCDVHARTPGIGAARELPEPEDVDAVPQNEFEEAMMGIELIPSGNLT